MLSKKILKKIRSWNQSEIKEFETFIEEENKKLINQFIELFKDKYSDYFSISNQTLKSTYSSSSMSNTIVIHKKNKEIESLIPDDLVPVLWLVEKPTDYSISRLLALDVRRTLYKFTKIKSELILKTVLEDPNRLSCVYYSLGQRKFSKIFDSNTIRALDFIINYNFKTIDDLGSFALSYANLDNANLFVLRKLANKADEICKKGLRVMPNYIDSNFEKDLHMQGLEIGNVLSQDEIDDVFDLKEIYQNNKNLSLIELSKINKRLLVFKKNFTQKELEEMINYNYTLFEEMGDVVVDKKLQLKIINHHPLYALKIKNITLESWICAIKKSPYMFRYCNRDDLPKEVIEGVYNSYPEFDSETSAWVFHNKYVFQQNTPSYILSGVEELMRKLGMGGVEAVQQHKNYKPIALSILDLFR